MHSEAADAQRQSAPGRQVRLVSLLFPYTAWHQFRSSKCTSHTCVAAHTQLHVQLASQASPPTCTLTLSVLELAGK